MQSTMMVAEDTVHHLSAREVGTQITAAYSSRGLCSTCQGQIGMLTAKTLAQSPSGQDAE